MLRRRQASEKRLGSLAEKLATLENGAGGGGSDGDGDGEGGEEEEEDEELENMLDKALVEAGLKKARRRRRPPPRCRSAVVAYACFCPLPRPAPWVASRAARSVGHAI